MLVGPTELGIEELAHLVRDPERLKRLARPRRWPVIVRVGLVLARLLVVLGGVALSATGVVDPLTAGLLALVALVGLSALRVVLVPPRGRKRDPYEEQAALAVIGAVVPDPMRRFNDEMRRETRAAPPPVMTGVRPTTCPGCARELEPEDDEEGEEGEEGEAGAWFCHHCGASLAPEQDKAP